MIILDSIGEPLPLDVSSEPEGIAIASWNSISRTGS